MALYQGWACGGRLFETALLQNCPPEFFLSQKYNDFCHDDNDDEVHADEYMLYYGAVNDFGQHEIFTTYVLPSGEMRCLNPSIWKCSPLIQMIQIFVKLSFVADNLLVVCTSLLLQSSDSSQTLDIQLFRRHQKLVRDPKCVCLQCISPVPSAGWFSSGKVVGRVLLAERFFSAECCNLWIL